MGCKHTQHEYTGLHVLCSKVATGQAPQLQLLLQIIKDTLQGSTQPDIATAPFTVSLPTAIML